MNKSYATFGHEEETKTEEQMRIEFDEINDKEPTLDSVAGMNGLKYAMAVAAAGGHHMLVWGKPGCGKTLALQHFPELLPLLTEEESESVTRIHSIAGLLRPDEGFKRDRPFRMPHQTASLEGMCGGGAKLRPGEISLAHNGTLFLDDAAEFRASALQMLRVPLETGSISISRAGRTTVYPANFQLIMTANPCPCGNYGSPDRACLCTTKFIERYWHKFSAPLTSRIGIRFDCNAEDNEEAFSLKELREMVGTAWERQMKRQGKRNQALRPTEIFEFIRMTDDAWKELTAATVNYSQIAIANIIKIARTLADIHGTAEDEPISPMYIRIALKLHAKLPADFS